MARRAEQWAELDGRGWRHLLLLSDSHGALAEPLVAAARDADCIVHAGDVGNAAVLAQLRASAPVVAVCGNNDTPEAWPAAERRELAALPAGVRIALAGGELVVLHGHQYPNAKQRHAALRRDHPQAHAVVYGHSHRLIVDEAILPWVLNPGACGRSEQSRKIGAGPGRTVTPA